MSDEPHAREVAALPAATVDPPPSPAATSARCITDVIDDIGTGPHHFWLLALVGMVLAAEGVEIFLMAYLRGRIAADFGVAEDAVSRVATAMFVGMLLGALLWGVASDIYGRKPALTAVLVLQVVGGVGSCLAPTVEVLGLARFVVGVGIGGLPLGMAMLLEALPRIGREKWVAAAYSCFSAGVVALCCVAFALRGESWRLLAAAAVAPYGVCLLLLRATPDSGKHLLLRGHADAAHHALATMARRNGRSEVVPEGMRLVADGDAAAAQHASGVHYAKHIAATLTGRDMRRVVAVLGGIWMGTALSYYVVAMATTVAFTPPARHGASGAAQSDAGGADTTAYGALLLLSLLELPAYVIVYFVLARLGRKRPLAVAPLVAAAGVAVFALVLPERADFSSPAFLCALGGVVVARGALSVQFDVVSVYTPEVFPTEVRSAGTGVCSAGARLAAIASPAVAFGLGGLVGWAPAPYVLVVAALVATSAVALLLPFDTKGRGLRDTGLGTEDGEQAPPAAAVAA